MPNQQLIDYIKQSRESGIGDSAIRQALLGSGYSTQDIMEAMSGLGVEKNVLENMQNKKPLFPDREPGESSGKSSSKLGRVIKVTLIILVILVGLIAGYFALSKYFPQYAKYVQPYIGPILDPMMDKIPYIGGTPIPSPTPTPTPASTPQFTDSDHDGLSDTDEVRYGTNPNDPDTDGDGYPDGEEVQNGYNPLGAGKATDLQAEEYKTYWQDLNLSIIGCKDCDLTINFDTEHVYTYNAKRYIANESLAQTVLYACFRFYGGEFYNKAINILSSSSKSEVKFQILPYSEAKLSTTPFYNKQEYIRTKECLGFYDKFLSEN